MNWTQGASGDHADYWTQDHGKTMGWGIQEETVKGWNDQVSWAVPEQLANTKAKDYGGKQPSTDPRTKIEERQHSSVDYTKTHLQTLADLLEQTMANRNQSQQCQQKRKDPESRADGYFQAKDGWE